MKKCNPGEVLTKEFHLPPIVLRSKFVKRVRHIILFFVFIHALIGWQSFSQR